MEKLNDDIHEWAMLPVNELVFSQDLLDLCKTNTCGNYNKSWTCPPVCETMEEQRNKIQSYKTVFVFTTKHDIEDSFDYEGMSRAGEFHSKLTIEVKEKLDMQTNSDNLIFAAGSCPVCKNETGKPCAFPEPCRHPDKKIGSIEAAGINVTELSKAAKIAYNNGANTVTFFSMVLLNSRQV